MTAAAIHRTGEETLGRDGLADLQRRKLADMLAAILPANRFYARKLDGIDFDPRRDPIDKLPVTTRAELQDDQAANPPFGTNLTYPPESYGRYHQTSGSTAAPLRWLDTAESWAWWKKCWGIVLRAAGVTEADRVLYPFSFGPFIGFWSSFEAAAELGCLVLPAGGMSTSARLEYLVANRVTVVCCTPTYAIRMAEVAEAEGIDLAGSPVRALVVAGEPGGGIPATRRRIEDAWGARLFDHTGMTEMGAVGFECEPAPGGMHLIESEYIVECIDPDTGRAVADGRRGELVLTNLGRWGSPLIRYRTGDHVQLARGQCACGRHFVRAEGGILGRVDDMVIVRGNNVFPSAIEGIVRGFDEVAEYRIRVDRDRSLSDLRIELEPANGADGEALARRVADAIRNRLHFRPRVAIAQAGSLPRFEMKSKRLVKE